MTAKLFILGRPGSGKSEAARRIVDHAKYRRFSAIHINDYQLLLAMAQADANHEYFYPTKYANGFDVLDFSVMDVALTKLEDKAKEYIRRVELIIIEFARDDYSKALKQFTPSFIQDAYFLYIETDTDTCVGRVHKRVVNPKTLDDHFVSEAIIRGYYKKKNSLYLASKFRTEYNVPAERLWIIDNLGRLENFMKDVDYVANRLLQLKTRILPETDPLQPAVRFVHVRGISF